MTVYEGEWPKSDELAGVLFGWVHRTKRRLYGVVYTREDFRGPMTWKYPVVVVLSNKRRRGL